jgi:CHAT domain-containing protein
VADGTRLLARSGKRKNAQTATWVVVRKHAGDAGFLPWRNANWVILSACNTGAGAGVEAASGLAQAFFYAGARTLLLTNWSVHSVSARELVADLLRRPPVKPDVTRSEALWQAMLTLMDGPGFRAPPAERP